MNLDHKKSIVTLQKGNSRLKVNLCFMHLNADNFFNVGPKRGVFSLVGSVSGTLCLSFLPDSVTVLLTTSILDSYLAAIAVFVCVCHCRV